MHRLDPVRDRAHEAPIEDFPVPPSQKDGFGRLCKTHWNQYTTALRKAAAAAKAESAPIADVPAIEPEPAEPRPRRAKGKAEPAVPPDEVASA